MPAVERNIDAETAQAWAVYAARLAGLEGAEYERAEQEAWASLQDALAELRDLSVLDRPSVG